MMDIIWCKYNSINKAYMTALLTSCKALTMDSGETKCLAHL